MAFDPCSPSLRPHEVLGLPADATTAQVRRAYKRLARKYHPDTNPKEGSSERFMAVKAAHDAMLDRIASGAPPPPPRQRTQSPPPAGDRWAGGPIPPPGAPPRTETIRPDVGQFRVDELPPWLLDEEVPRRELRRVTLYVGAAFIWLFAFWLFLSTLHHVLAPHPRTPPPDDGQVQR